MNREKWTDQFLDRMRGQMDPLADQAVAAVFEAHSIDRVNRLMTDMVGHDTARPEALPEPVRAFLAKSSTLPDWADTSRIALGEELFGDWGVCSCTILACASLPECYLMRNGIHVLATTQRLQQHAKRRVLETAQMIMAVMLKGGLTPDGPGIRAAQKVRLMHATIRFLILQEPDASAPQPKDLAGVLRRERWNAAYGQPINQEDLAFTLMTFSHVAIRSLGRLGVDLTAAQKDAYVHCWNVVGHIMGIQADLLPTDHVEAEILFERIKQRQAGPTPEARDMQRALTDFMTGLMPAGPLKRLPITVTRQLIGDADADTLGIPRPPWRDAFVQGLVLAVWRLIDRELRVAYRDHSGLRLGSAWLHDLLMIEIGKLPAGWNKELFNMPRELVARLPPDWQHSPVEVPSTFTSGLLSKL